MSKSPPPTCQSQPALRSGAIPRERSRRPTPTALQNRYSQTRLRQASTATAPPKPLPTTMASKPPLRSTVKIRRPDRFLRTNLSHGGRGSRVLHWGHRKSLALLRRPAGVPWLASMFRHPAALLLDDPPAGAALPDTAAEPRWRVLMGAKPSTAGVLGDLAGGRPAGPRNLACVMTASSRWLAFRRRQCAELRWPRAGVRRSRSR